MNPSPTLTPERQSRCLELAALVCNGQAGQEEFTELESLLQTSAEAREQYRSYVNLHAGLHRFFKGAMQTAETGEILNVLPPLNSSRSRPVAALKTTSPAFWVRHRQLTAFAASALVMMSVIFGMLAYLQNVWDQEKNNSQILFTSGGTVASIGQLDQIQWSPEHSLSTRLGDELEAGGRVKLAAGKLRLDFFSGAMVLLEGPAELELHSSRGGRLIHGKLSAVVTAAAKGFRIQTPSSTVIDLGTEFGVQADANGDSELHVFEGRVSLVTGKGDENVQVIELTGGEARKVSAASGMIEEIALADRAFTRVGDLSPRYEIAVRATQPAGYWRFEEESVAEIKPVLPTAYRLNPKNVTTDDRGPALGRMEPSRCLYFDGNTGQIEILGPNPALTRKQYSVVLWVRPEGAGAQNVFTGTAAEGPLVHWSQQLRLTRDRQFEHYAFDQNPPGKPGGQLIQMMRPEPVQLGRWHHLAITGEEGGQMSLYVDGQQSVSPVSAPVKYQQVIDRFVIGAASGGGRQTMRAFEGAIDELALYDRALTAEEIKTLHEAAGR